MTSKHLQVNFKNNPYNDNNHKNFVALYDLISNRTLSFFNLLRTKKYLFLKNWIDDNLLKLKDDTYNISTKCYWILNGLTDFPTCQYSGCKNKIGIGKNIKITKGYPSYCCQKHAQKSYEVIVKRKNTTRKNYGVDFPIQNEQIHTKIKQTCIQTYNVENPFQSEEVKEKSKQSLIKNYGVDNPRKSIILQQKTESTCIKRFGETSFSKTQEFIEKIKATNLKNRGVEFPSQSEQVKERFQKTCKLKYGEFHPMKNDEIKEKCMKNRTRSYLYEGISFDSSPELAMYIFLKDHKMQFKYQPHASFTFEHNSEKHTYFPDFEINGKYIELKGNQFLKEDGTWQCPYDHSLDALYEAKHQCLLKNEIQIMYFNDYKKYLDYIDEKYGKNFLNQFSSKHINEV